jgi:cysteine desulfurase
LESVLRPTVVDLRGATWSEPLGYQIAHDATRFELSEANVAAQLGLKAAVDYLLELGQADVQAAILRKAEYLRRGLNAITGIHLHGDGRAQSGIVSFTVDGVDATEVQQTLWTMGVTVATVDRSTALLDMSARHLQRLVRASPHYFVTTEELDRAVEAIARIAFTDNSRPDKHR